MIKSNIVSVYCRMEHSMQAEEQPQQAEEVIQQATQPSSGFFGSFRNKASRFASTVSNKAKNAKNKALQHGTKLAHSVGEHVVTHGTAAAHTIGSKAIKAGTFAAKRGLNAGLSAAVGVTGGVGAPVALLARHKLGKYINTASQSANNAFKKQIQNTSAKAQSKLHSTINSASQSANAYAQQSLNASHEYAQKQANLLQRRKRTTRKTKRKTLT